MITERLGYARGLVPFNRVVGAGGAVWIDVAERICRRQHTEQIKNGGEKQFRIAGVGRDGGYNSVAHLGRRIAVLDVTEILEQIHEREVECILRIGRPTGRQNKPALQPPGDFVNEARLPDARLSDNANDLPVPLFDA